MTHLPSVPAPTRDEDYYLNEVVFLVEDHLFKVPRYHFEKNSDIFRTTFTLPRENNGNVEGSSDKKPFKLEGITKVDFQALLKVMYPLQIPQDLNMPREVWLSALKLSTMWNFCAVRTLAIEQLSKGDMDAVDKILFAREYHVPEWLSSGYNILANRNKSISVAEVERLGLDTAVRMFHVRERRFRDQLMGCALLRVIHREFAQELREKEAANAAYTAIPVSYRDLQDPTVLVKAAFRFYTSRNI